MQQQQQQHKTVCYIKREIMDPKQEEDEEEIYRLLLGIMEGYSDSVIPPLSQLCPLYEGTTVSIEEANNNKASSSSRKRLRPKYEAKDQQLQKGRAKREKMTENYALLQSMLPNLFPIKATREKIVSETVDYIKVLKKELRKLEELKNSSESTMENWKMSQCTNRNTSINLNVSGNVAFFGIQSFARQELVTQIFMVFQKHNAEVLAANVAVNNGQLTLTVTATMNGNKNYTVEKIKRDILAL